MKVSKALLLAVCLSSGVITQQATAAHSHNHKHAHKKFPVKWSAVNYKGDPASNYEARKPAEVAAEAPRRLREGEGKVKVKAAPAAGGVVHLPPKRKDTAPARVLTATSDSAPYQNIRILVDTSQLEADWAGAEHADKIKYIEEDILPSAFKWIQEALRVQPVDGKLKLTPACTADGLWTDGTCETVETQCGFTTMPADHLAAYQTCDANSVCTDHEAGAGVDADFILYVSAGHECDGGTLAFASTCYRDQNDRPIAGYFNYCAGAFPDDVPLGTNFSDDVSTVIHENFHAFGFSNDDPPLFRNEATKEPLTARDETTGLPAKVTIKDASGNDIDVPDADPSVMTIEADGDTGRYVFTLKTPNVMQFAEEHFGCSVQDGLIGLRLEDEGGDGTSWSHWEKRQMGPEAMTGEGGAFPATWFTQATLAFFQDSGWYKAEFSSAGEYVWGRGKGCAFLNDVCVSNAVAGENTGEFTGTTVDETAFCLVANKLGCTTDMRARAYCDLEDPLADANDKQPETEQYFGADNVGGFQGNANNCPLWAYNSVAESSRSETCTDSEVPFYGGVTDPADNNYGEFMGEDSQCFESTLLATGFTYSNAEQHQKGLCYKRTCEVDDALSTPAGNVYKSVTITVTRADLSTVDVVCTAEEAGQSKSVAGYQGGVICPDVQRNCFGWPCKNGGFWRNNKCACNTGYIGKFCELKDTLTNRALTPSRMLYSNYEGTLVIGSAYTFTPEIVGTPDSYQLAAGVSLPQGLTLDSATGVVSGNPNRSSACKVYAIEAVQGEQSTTGILRLQVVSDAADVPANIEPCGGQIPGEVLPEGTVVEDTATTAEPAVATDSVTTAAGSGTEAPTTEAAANGEGTTAAETTTTATTTKSVTTTKKASDATTTKKSGGTGAQNPQGSDEDGPGDQTTKNGTSTSGAVRTAVGVAAVLGLIFA